MMMEMRDTKMGMGTVFGGDAAGDKYQGRLLRWTDKGNHYELTFMDNFMTPSSCAHGGDKFVMLPSGNSVLTDILQDMRAGDKHKEVHVFVGSYGGEVAALNMILQQLLSYEYRVGINTGTACSCGWMLLFACQERYVSPFSEAMYHDISCGSWGKHSELRSSAEFLGRWQKELLKATDTIKVLTPQELELGRTSEVWFTGQDLIDRKAARPYAEYLKRSIPEPVHGFVQVGGEVFGQTKDGWVRSIPDPEAKPLTYAELVELDNREEPPKTEDPEKKAEKSKTAPETPEKNNGKNKEQK